MVRAAFAIALAACVASCGGESPLARFTPSRTPHEAYTEALRSAGLHESAAGQAWLARAREALETPLAPALPFQETGYFDPLLPSAAGYRVELPRGRALSVDITFEASRPAKLFVDLFRVTERGPEHVASADEGSLTLHYVSRAAGAYVLRLHPELLAGGRYTITQRSEATLRFPVQGVDERAIQSVFGDARDAGRRDHHGVDIFAPRGTPVVAAADGVVGRVETTEIGGRVIWLYDRAQGQSLYYAHLNDWAVRDGQDVKAGDVLGYVGNTGNARTTPPHLHFGIYSRGPVDPLPFIRASDRTPQAPSGRTAMIGRWGRISRQTVLRPALVRDAGGAALPAATAVHVRAAIAASFRVSLPDGRSGFVAAGDVVPLDRALRTSRVDGATVLRDGPSDSASAIRPLDENAPVAIFAAFDGFVLARLGDGRRGWLRESRVRR